MDRHPIPRQITTFEFKLIGFLTVKQFVYLLIFTGIAVIVYFAILVPYLNIVLASLVAGFGLIFVFVKYNERPLDIWMKNLFLALVAPSQYYYIKHNRAPRFLESFLTKQDPQTIATHIDAQKKLRMYTAKTSPKPTEDKKNTISRLLAEPLSQSGKEIQPHPPQTTTTRQQGPYLSGMIKNSKGQGLPNIMVYIASSTGEVVRILKTNHHGVFATFHSLPAGTYKISPKDLTGTYPFDTMDLNLPIAQNQPVTIASTNSYEKKEANSAN